MLRHEKTYREDMEGGTVNRASLSEHERISNCVRVRRGRQVVRSKREAGFVIIAGPPAIAPWASFTFDWAGSNAKSHDGESDE